MEKDPEAQSSGGVESPDMKIKQLENLIRRDQDHQSDDDHENDEEDHESDEDHLDIFKKQLESLSVEEVIWNWPGHYSIEI